MGHTGTPEFVRSLSVREVASRDEIATIVGIWRRACNVPGTATWGNSMDISHYFQADGGERCLGHVPVHWCTDQHQDGRRVAADERRPLTAGECKMIAYSLMDSAQISEFEREKELNMAISVPGSGRFRVNVFQQRGEVGMVIRTIRSIIPTIEDPSCRRC